MDDAFSLIAAQMPPRRRISPFQMRSTAMLGVVVALLAAFAMFVNGQQRAADARRSSPAAQQEAAREAEVQAVAQDLLDTRARVVDGPSTAPSIVSVFTGTAGWSAAVHGSGDTCYWVAMSASGHARYGTGAPCTGIAALAADRSSW